MKLSKMF